MVKRFKQTIGKTRAMLLVTALLAGALSTLAVAGCGNHAASTANSTGDTPTASAGGPAAPTAPVAPPQDAASMQNLKNKLAAHGGPSGVYK